MDERERNFKSQFMASFLAAYCAECERGKLNYDSNNLPVRKAELLAGRAFEQLKNSGTIL